MYVLREIRLVISGHLLSRDAAGADVLLASRPLIEGHIRRRVLALENVTVRERCDVARPGDVARPRARRPACGSGRDDGTAARRCARPI